MSHGNDVAVTAPPSAPCIYPWCHGLFCATADNGERFHRGLLSSEGGPSESLGVDLVCNDFADGTSTGPQVDITFTNRPEFGIAQHSIALEPLDALRHGSAVIRAALIALARR